MRLILTALLCLSGPLAFAQQSAPPADASPAVPASAAPASMEEPRQGDNWTFDVKDEISGKVTSKRTTTITEVTPTSIAVHFTTDKEKEGFQIYDRNWNLKTGNAAKFTPNNGLGVVPPLKVGASWPIKVEQTNTEKGFTWKWAGQSKVTGEEKLTTKAGTFETFKIESTYVVTPVKNPGRKFEFAVQTWYAPAIDHWVLQTHTVRTDNMLHTNTKTELVAYGRKQ